MTSETKEALCAHLAQFVTENKLARMERVIGSRTRAVTVVWRTCFNLTMRVLRFVPVNASACRMCTSLRIVSPISWNPDVVMGASKWVDLYRYSGEGEEHTTACFEGLKRSGYRIVATSLRDDSIPLEELPVEQDIALCFGTEEEGLSERAERLADVSVKIPMHGFTQSLNISVSVAVCLYELCRRIRRARRLAIIPEGASRRSALLVEKRGEECQACRKEVSCERIILPRMGTDKRERVSR